MFEQIEEGSAKALVPKEKKISKKLPVFYNPAMKYNRDMSIQILNSYDRHDLKIALPLAGTGIRGIRFVKELNKGKVKELIMNDHDEESFELMKKNVKLNRINTVAITNVEANALLKRPFDYIDIDPFGSPNPFLDSACRSVYDKGILAVTATDTAPLCGTYPDACLRKYWALPLRSHLMHEVGLRILIRKVQLIAAQYDKAMTPIFSYSRDHYFRSFFQCRRGKARVDEIIRQHGEFEHAGPMWLGPMQDKNILKKLAPDRFTDIIKQELDTIGFYDIHMFCKKNRLTIPRTEAISEALKKAGFTFSRTHFSLIGFKSDISEKKLKDLISRLRA